MDTIMREFLRVFEASFQPPVPYRGQTGTNWLISRVWSDYMKSWLHCNYRVKFERPLRNGRRLDAALWSNIKGEDRHQERMDIALEWEWDNNKVASDFLSGDFRKIFEVDARCGLAIVQTKVSHKGGSAQADRTMEDLRRLCKMYRRDNRSVVLIEIRRLLHRKARVEFLCHFQDLVTLSKQRIARWQFSEESTPE